MAGVVLDLVGEVCDELGSPCQVDPPDGIGMERLGECQGARGGDLGWWVRAL